MPQAIDKQFTALHARPVVFYSSGGGAARGRRQTNQAGHAAG